MLSETARRLRVARGFADTVLVTKSGRRVGDAAAESAFFLALAILPMMLTTTAVLRAMRPLLGRQAGPGVEHGLARLLRVVLTSRGGAAADAADRLLSSASGGLLTIGSLAALVLVTRAMRSILTGLAEVGQRSEPARPGFVREWSTAATLAVMAVVLAAVILAMVAVGPLLGHSREVATNLDRFVQAVWTALRWPVGIALVFLFLLLLHTVGLRAHVSGRRTRRAALTGAAVTAVGAIGASALLPVYVHIVGSVSQTVGALGGGLILLIWSYLLAFAVLLGAEVRVLMIAAGQVDVRAINTA